MLTYRTIFLLVLFGACGVGIGILGRIDSLYAAVSFVLFPIILAVMIWSAIYDLRRSSVATHKAPLSPSQGGKPEAERTAHPPIAA